MKRHRGFVLVMTVALIALAAAAMVRLANRSLSVVRRGIVAQHDLQERWSAASCRISVLQRADDLFQQSDEQVQRSGAGWPLPNEIHLVVKLNDQPLRIVLKDEQAGANVNSVYQRQPQRLFSSVARAALVTSAPLRLRPLPETSTSGFRRFTSWGQIVDLSRVPRGRSLHDVIAPITGTFTCWGDGRINIRRASDEALRLAISDIVNDVEAEELLQARRGHTGPVEGLWASLDLHRRKQLSLNQAVTAESQCYSLEISRSAAPREPMTLTVYDPSDRASSPMKMFQW